VVLLAGTPRSESESGTHDATRIKGPAVHCFDKRGLNEEQTMDGDGRLSHNDFYDMPSTRDDVRWAATIGVGATEHDPIDGERFIE
jgi:hypothetical protein